MESGLCDARDGGVHLHHGQPPAGCRNRVTFARVRLLPNPQRIQFGLKGAAVSMPPAVDNPTFFDSSFVFVDWLSFRFLRSQAGDGPRKRYFGPEP
jgi:hypothetical protein